MKKVITIATDDDNFNDKLKLLRFICNSEIAAAKRKRPQREMNGCLESLYAQA
jgi:hypothetical protein